MDIKTEPVNVETTRYCVNQPCLSFNMNSVFQTINKIIFVFSFWFLPLCFLSGADAKTLTDRAQKIFEFNNHAVFQIQVIDIKSRTKSVIGSGFKISHDGLFATNFHVISDVVDKPDQYSIEYYRDGHKEGNLEVQAIDVANDLALLKGTGSNNPPLPLGDSKLGQGVYVYPMGNPLDVGMVIIEGTYNGLVGGTSYQRVLLSASLNSGMSGGPAFDASGNVVGVNVRIQGNDLSYLVPVEYLKKLVKRYREKGPQQNWSETIQEQVLEYYGHLIEEALQSEWPYEEFGSLKVPKNILPQVVKCWGKSRPEDTTKNQSYFYAYKWCKSDQDIFLSSTHSTGTINYIFYWMESESLNSLGFYRKYADEYSKGIYNSKLDENEVTEFNCQNHFVKITDRDWKAAYCVRQYKKYPKLHELFLSFAVLGDSQRKHVIQVSLSGLSEPLARRLLQKFLGGIQWNE